MKITWKLTLLLCLALAAGHAQQWQPRQDIPVAGRWEALCFAIGPKIYVGGGYKGDFISLNDLWEYDTENDTWTQKANLPGSPNRTAGIAFSGNGKGYIGLGSVNYNTINAAFLNDLWAYDPVADVWSHMTPLPDSGRHEAAVFVAADKAYVVGGVVDYPDAATNDVWEYDLASDTWTPVADHPARSLSGAMAFGHGTMGYVTCGYARLTGASTGEASNALYQYDPVNDTWTQKADYCGSARRGGVAFVLGDSAFVGLGTAEVPPLTYFFEEFCSYDFASDTWNASAGYPEIARAYSVAAVAGGKAYVGSGWLYLDGNQHYYTSWYEFHTTAPPAGMEEATADNPRCYPNPASDRLFLQGLIGQGGSAAYAFYNASGQMTARGTVSGGAPIDVSGISEGAYFIEVTGEYEAYRQRVFVAH